MLRRLRDLAAGEQGIGIGMLRLEGDLAAGEQGIKLADAFASGATWPPASSVPPQRGLPDAELGMRMLKVAGEDFSSRVCRGRPGRR